MTIVIFIVLLVNNYVRFNRIVDPQASPTLARQKHFLEKHAREVETRPTHIYYFGAQNKKIGAQNINYLSTTG